MQVNICCANGIPNLAELNIDVFDYDVTCMPEYLFLDVTSLACPYLVGQEYERLSGMAAKYYFLVHRDDVDASGYVRYLVGTMPGYTTRDLGWCRPILNLSLDLDSVPPRHCNALQSIVNEFCNYLYTARYGAGKLYIGDKIYVHDCYPNIRSEQPIYL